ncbi:unnamed protein product [Clonostachys rosea f. rosea IK726]|uniref:Uncharacterized protein n=1 Tax=Clonostachys rosea f. rosea IK726 TaxID=1349383 RepID=A0ACA9UB43_BIOOC|nr:unnamed protein product [Clonostachys rosea f. rosea IK726]
MVFEFRPYTPPQSMPQKSKRKQHAVSLPQNHIQTANAAENIDDVWPSQCAGDTVKEITDETPGSPDELPSIEELLKATWPNDNTNSTSHVQTDSNTESSGKTQDYAIIIDEDMNLDHSVDNSKSLQTLDRTFLAPASGDTDGSVNVVTKCDTDDNQLSAAEELLHAQAELDSALTYSETTDFSTDPPIEAPCPAPATKMSAERASLESSDAGTRNESTSTSPAADEPPTPPPVADEMSESEWEAFEIIGEKMINGKRHYRVDWKPTYEPEENCVSMRELIEEWKKSKTRRRKGGKRTGNQTVQLAQEAGVSKKATKSHGQGKMSNNNKDSTKRPRGRPRKM